MLINFSYEHSGKMGMDLEDAKALIRSLLTASTLPYNIPRLERDFREEAGIPIPLFGFQSTLHFLLSLSDTLRVINKPPKETIRLIESSKSHHIASLVNRQASKKKIYITRHRNEDNRMKKKTIVGTSKSLNSNMENNIEKNTFKKEPSDYIFKEDDIGNLNEISDEIKPSEPQRGSVSGVTDIVDVHNESSNCETSSVNELVKANLRELIKSHPKGIWCCDLPDLYFKRFKCSLDFREYGYKNLIEMVIELNDIFRYERPGIGDWMLSDASGPLCPQKKAGSRKHFAVPEALVKNLQKLVEDHCKNKSKGIYLEDFLPTYFKMYRLKFSFEQFGFKNLKAFLKSMDGKILKMNEVNNRWIITPLVKNPESAQPMDKALQITPDDELFRDLFPENVVTLGEKFSVLNPEECFPAGKGVEVNVCEVWSPKKFYIILSKCKPDLDKLMDALQVFYTKNMDHYKMPESTIKVKQVCAGLYSGCGAPYEWQRGFIVRVKDEKKVTVNFIDFGTVAELEKKNIRFLHRDFFSLPAQAVAAKLYNVRPVDGESWPFSSSKRFLNLVSAPSVEIFVTKLEVKARLVLGELFIVVGEQRISINQTLIQEGIAAFNTESGLSGVELKYSKENRGRKKIASTAENNLQNDVNISPKKDNVPLTVNNFDIQTKEDLNNQDNEKGYNLMESSLVEAHEEKKSVEDVSIISTYTQTDISFLSDPCVKDDDHRYHPFCCDNGGGTIANEEKNDVCIETKTRALAYSLLRGNERLREVARLDVDCAINSAITLAQCFYLNKGKFKFHFPSLRAEQESEEDSVTDVKGLPNKAIPEEIISFTKPGDDSRLNKISPAGKYITVKNFRMYHLKGEEKMFVSLSEVFGDILSLETEHILSVASMVWRGENILKMKKSDVLSINEKLVNVLPSRHSGPRICFIIQIDIKIKSLPLPIYVMKKNGVNLGKEDFALAIKSSNFEELVVLLPVEAFPAFVVKMSDFFNRFSALFNQVDECIPDCLGMNQNINRLFVALFVLTVNFKFNESRSGRHLISENGVFKLAIGVSFPIDLTTKGMALSWVSNLQAVYKLPDNVTHFEPHRIAYGKSIRNTFTVDLLRPILECILDRFQIPGAQSRLLFSPGIKESRLDHGNGLLQEIVDIILPYVDSLNKSRSS